MTLYINTHSYPILPAVSQRAVHKGLLWQELYNSIFEMFNYMGCNEEMVEQGVKQ